MKTLIEKELRLMLPAFCAAMALAIVPVWILPTMQGSAQGFGSELYLFGAMVLALSVFGRETGLKTLSFVMAQPLERQRVWWTKIAVLAVLAALVFDAWWLSSSLGSISLPGREIPDGVRNFSLLLTIVFIAGGLWMTLLLRQVIAAFWLNLLVPGAIAAVIEMIGGPDWLIFSVLGLYAVAVFFLALRQFLHLQDTAWTGGVISFGSGRSAATDRPSARERRTWVALIAKEFQIQQITLAGTICLSVLHLGAIVVHKLGEHSFSKMTLLAMEGFGLLWFVVPVIAGCQSVAEERQLGTLEPILCLPVSRRIQFAIKLIFVVVLGGLLSAALFRGIEGLGAMLGLKAALSIPSGLTYLAFVALCIAGVFASSLTRGIVPALGVAVLTVTALWNCLGHPRNPVADLGFLFFQGTLWTFLAVPLVLAVLAWLAYRNFGSVSEGGRLWRRNAAGLALALAGTFALTTGIYHRAWELVEPMEPAHGTARISLGKAPALSFYGALLSALFPDGRLRVDRILDLPRWNFAGTGLGQKWQSVDGAFVPGSNWLDAAATFLETAAIRSDGTLWVSLRLQEIPLTQFDHDHDWQSVAARSQQKVLLLKRDGTLWELGASSWGQANGIQSLREFVPRKIGAESNWASIITGVHPPFLWKKDGTAWALHTADNETAGGGWVIPDLKVIEPSAEYDVTNVVHNVRRIATPLHAWQVFTSAKTQQVVKQVHEPGNAVEPLPGLNNLRTRALARVPNSMSFVYVRDDGTLWLWNWKKDRWLRAQGEKGGSAPDRIGTESDWANFVSSYYSLVGLKTGGTLWKWNLDPSKMDGENWDYSSSKNPALTVLEKPPVEMSAHTDWVGLGTVGWRIVSLSADGGLWIWPWPEPRDFTSSLENGQQWGLFLKASRRPELIENIFGGAQ